MENLQQHNKRLRLSFSEYTEKLINKLELESFSYGDGKLIALTKENANKIKEYLKREPDYYSTAEVICKKIMYDNGGSFPFNDKYSCHVFLKIIDSENSTDVWMHDRNGFDAIVNFMYDSENKFFERVKTGDSQLIDDMRVFCKNKLAKKDNKSLCSKICKYTSDYVFDNRDSFYIYDSVIAKMLPKYLDAYECNLKFDYKNDTYNHLFKCLNELNEKADSVHECKLTKDELDSIIWFSFRK